jgi:hypothetical protein
MLMYHFLFLEKAKKKITDSKMIDSFFFDVVEEAEILSVPLYFIL